MKPNRGKWDTRNDQCWYNDHQYTEGDKFTSSDGCNQCNCKNGWISCSKRACSMCKTVGGPDAGAPCVFPFYFGDRKHKSCTMLESGPNGRAWCSTKTNDDGHHKLGDSWGYCPRGGCKGCLTTSGPDAGVPCVFPFIFKGRSYTKCTMVHAKDGRPWCSTRTDSRGHHVGGKRNWGNCPYNGCDTEFVKTALDKVREDQLRKYLLELSREPHIAAGRRDRELVSWIRREWEKVGIEEVNLATYNFLLSYPNTTHPNKV